MPTRGRPRQTTKKMKSAASSNKKIPELIKALTCVIAILLSGSCASPRNLVLTCQERQIEIYADGQYLGSDMVYYTVPKGQKYVEVSCRDNGVEVYSKKVFTDDLKNGNLVELQIPKYLKYSNNRH